MKGGGVAPGGLYHFVLTGVTICMGLGDAGRRIGDRVGGIVCISTFVVVVSVDVVLSVVLSLVLIVLLNLSSVVVEPVLCSPNSISKSDMSVDGSSVVEVCPVASSKSDSSASSVFRFSSSTSPVSLTVVNCVVVANVSSLVCFSATVLSARTVVNVVPLSVDMLTSVVDVLDSSVVVLIVVEMSTMLLLLLATVLAKVLEPDVESVSISGESTVVPVLVEAGVEERTIC